MSGRLRAHLAAAGRVEVALLAAVAAVLLADFALLAVPPGPITARVRLAIAVAAVLLVPVGTILGAGRGRGYGAWVALATPPVLAYAFTSVTIPRDQLTWWLAGIVRDVATAVVGESVAAALVRSPGQRHYVLAGLWVVLFVGLVWRTLRSTSGAGATGIDG